jgi:D-alanyl-D-alanine dipeptidase
MPTLPLPKYEKLQGAKRRITYPGYAPIEYDTKPTSDGFETNILALHPKFRPLVEKLIATLTKRLDQTKYRIQINNTFRTQEQEEMIKRTNPSVAAKTYSPHCYGMAIDISVVDKKTGAAVTSRPEIQAVLEQVAKELGLMWGGWFKTMTKEPWHFQIAPLGQWEKIYLS